MNIYRLKRWYKVNKHTLKLFFMFMAFIVSIMGLTLMIGDMLWG